MTEPQSLEEFWPYYVSQHQDPTCRKLHFIGTSLLAAPVFGYGFAWVGHFAFEKNKPASWGGAKAFYWSLRSDFKMWAHTIAGTMDAEVEKYRPAKLAVV